MILKIVLQLFCQRNTDTISGQHCGLSLIHACTYLLPLGACSHTGKLTIPLWHLLVMELSFPGPWASEHKWFGACFYCIVTSKHAINAFLKVLKDEFERVLALTIMKFPDVVESVVQVPFQSTCYIPPDWELTVNYYKDLLPSRLCDYTYSLCVTFNEFYGSCKVSDCFYSISFLILWSYFPFCRC
jgi:hypothetical protein